MVSILFLLFGAGGSFAVAALPVGCADAKNISEEAYQAWLGEKVSVVSTVEARKSTLVPLGARSEVVLIPHGPEASGYVHFEIPQSGAYILATDLYPRMDLNLAPLGEELAPADFGKVRGCDTIAKTLRFQLEGPSRYDLKITSRRGAKVSLLIFSAPVLKQEIKNIRERN